MQTFKLNTEGLTRRILLRAIPTIIISLTFFFTIFIVQGGNVYVDATYYIFPVILILGTFSFSLWRGIKKQKVMAESYELTISDQLICREQLNTPDISILVTEVIEIAKHPKGGFTIKGSRNNGTIIIPVQIEHYEQLEATLQQIHPITIKSNSLFKKLQFLLPFIVGGLMICVYAVNNKVIVGAAGSVLTGLMIWSLIKIQKDKNVDRKTKNRTWIVLLVLVSVIASIIIKLTAPSLP
ncbi:hypothetical protein A4H97_29210 [Niastella yeongjuensis]|uniref:Uncharacterized protein n=1 Tax=Niastella yeongjuensis TaxID=354355 RepID=A0A1V9ES73_9BACT|nr:hypothetical protein [Niastella yeongjuensis]OQP48966.1 hypothetical protein A4H97_29210 [Niastella yeongjuensis]SEP09194.1 hypothetical protein SAMN05660816_04339 [Niastella yeongjuensis]